MNHSIKKKSQTYHYPLNSESYIVKLTFFTFWADHMQFL